MNLKISYLHNKINTRCTGRERTLKQKSRPPVIMQGKKNYNGPIEAPSIPKLFSLSIEVQWFRSKGTSKNIFTKTKNESCRANKCYHSKINEVLIMSTVVEHCTPDIWKCWPLQYKRKQ
jgi:hypothetical protein